MKKKNEQQLNTSILSLMEDLGLVKEDYDGPLTEELIIAFLEDRGAFDIEAGDSVIWFRVDDRNGYRINLSYLPIVGFETGSIIRQDDGIPDAAIFRAAKEATESVDLVKVAYWESMHLAHFVIEALHPDGRSFFKNFDQYIKYLDKAFAFFFDHCKNYRVEQMMDLVKDVHNGMSS